MKTLERDNAFFIVCLLFSAYKVYALVLLEIVSFLLIIWQNENHVNVFLAFFKEVL